MAILEENDILFAHKALNIMAGGVTVKGEKAKQRVGEATRRVAGAIIDHFNKRTGQCDPSIERLATLLGIDRATVIRATEALNELGFIEKISHGGKAHRAAYKPNWVRFRAIVDDWDARMKTGDAPGTPASTPETPEPNVAKLRRSRSQGCDVKGRKVATQTHRSNPSNKPFEGERLETQAQKHQQQHQRKGQNGLWRGNRPGAQRSMFLPINGGRSPSHSDAANAAAERRWYADVHALGLKEEEAVLEWMTSDRQEATTEAEKRRKGGGLAFIVANMQCERMRAYG